MALVAATAVLMYCGAACWLAVHAPGQKLATRFSLHLVKDALENVGPAVPVRAPARSLIKFPARLIWLEAQSLMANISVALADCRNWRVSCAARSPALAFDPASANLPMAFISASVSIKFVPLNCRHGGFIPWGDSFSSRRGNSGRSIEPGRRRHPRIRPCSAIFV